MQFLISQRQTLHLFVQHSRALRALAASIADIVGPSLWGLKPGDAVVLMQHLFEFKSKTSCNTDLNSNAVL